MEFPVISHTCPICDRIFKEPVELMPCKHCVCSRCLPVNTNCPICGQKYDDTKQNTGLASDIKRTLEAAMELDEVTLDKADNTEDNICSFQIMGTGYIKDQFYYCKTCGIVGDLLCCQACAKYCHKDHEIEEASSNRPAFCDCCTSGTKCMCRLVTNGSCTFQDQKENLFQKMYHCKTCKIIGDKCCCEACARICHVGHVVELVGEIEGTCACGKDLCHIFCRLSL